MKALRDGVEVSPRSYYFLLDWNDRDNFKTLYKIGRTRLLDCNIAEYATLFAIAMNAEHKELLTKVSPYLKQLIISNQDDKYDNICFELDET